MSNINRNTTSDAIESTAAISLTPASGNDITLAVAGNGRVVLNSGLNVNNQFFYDENDNEILQFSAGGTAVNYLTIWNETAAGNPFYGMPTIEANGSDANIDINLKPKNAVDGTGTVYIHGNVGIHADAAITDSGGSIMLDFYSTGTPVNYVEISNQDTGSSPSVSAKGSDANIDLNLNSKGTGFAIGGNGIATGDGRIGSLTGTVDLLGHLDVYRASVSTRVSVQADATYNPNFQLQNSAGTKQGSFKFVDATTEVQIVNDANTNPIRITGSTGIIVDGTSVIDDIVSESNGDITVVPNGTGKTKITSIEAPLDVNAQTGTTYTAVIADAGKMITLNNASAITMTIPANASVAYPVGTELKFKQLGAGQVTVAITTDTLNVNSNLTLLLKGQYSEATAFKETSTTWTLKGDLAPVTSTDRGQILVFDLTNGAGGGEGNTSSPYERYPQNVVNVNSYYTITSNRLVLDAGTYLFETAGVPVQTDGQQNLLIYDYTNTATLYTSSYDEVSTSAEGPVHIADTETFGVTTTVEFRGQSFYDVGSNIVMKVTRLD